ncbi:1802_t:CDS:2 [Gigaspora margarita]|uniref:protein-ribulosamine 3-kinase n=1 Tax=Gigaspora margarita TaxID=4874 RepID=A0ABM8W1Q2_GIGMA|nr:1802_t:CDS:2 [Gigaspora margarita]
MLKKTKKIILVIGAIILVIVVGRVMVYSYKSHEPPRSPEGSETEKPPSKTIPPVDKNPPPVIFPINGFGMVPGNREIFLDSDHALYLFTDKGRFFVKINNFSDLSRFEYEKESMLAINEAVPDFAPHPLVLGNLPNGGKFLVVNFIEGQKLLAKKLAQLHQQKSPNGAIIGNKVIPDLLGNLQIEPVLLHGNLDFDIFDAHSYYEHNEMDLSLLGNRSFYPGDEMHVPEFLAEYQKHQPLQPGFEDRKLLYRNIPTEIREHITELVILPLSERENLERVDRLGSQPRDTTFDYYIDGEKEILMGTLDLSSFINLESLKIDKNYLSKLILAGCQHLESIEADGNLLREIVLPLRTDHLERVYLTNNNFPVQDLSIFSNYTNLEILFLGTDDETRIRRGIYNRLSQLSNLEELDINATDIDRGLEYLPTNRLFNFTFGNQGRVGAGVDCLKSVLENFAELEEGETMEQ